MALISLDGNDVRDVRDVCGSMWGLVSYVHKKKHREYDKISDGNVDILQALMEALVIQ